MGETAPAVAPAPAAARPSLLGRLVPRRIAPRVVASFALVLTLTVVVGGVGLIAARLLADRMAIAGETAALNGALRETLGESRRFVAAAGNDGTAALVARLDADAAALAAFGGRYAGRPVVAAQTAVADDALADARARVAEVAQARDRLTTAETALSREVTAIESAALAAGEAVIARVRDGRRADQAARTDLAALGRVDRSAAAMAEIVAGLRRALDAGAEMPPLDGFARPLRIARSAVSPEAKAAFDTIAPTVEEMRPLVAVPAPLRYPGALAGRLDRLDAALAALRADAASRLAPTLEAMAAAEAAGVAGDALAEGMGKLQAEVNGLKLEVARFLGGADASEAALGRQVDQLAHVVGILAADGAADAAISGLSAGLQPRFAAIRAGAATVTAARGALRASATGLDTALGAAAEALGAVAAEEEAGADRDARIASIAILAAAAAALVLGIAVALALVASLRRPLAGLTAAMRRLADGDTGIVLAGADRRDEIGDMTRAVAVFRANAEERERLAALAEADDAARAARQARVEALIAAFRGEAARLLADVERNADVLEQTAQALTGVAQTTAREAATATGSAATASGNVEAVAAAAEELAASIGEISRQVTTTAGVIASATESTATANGRVEGLAAIARRVGDVVGLIRSIAEQTNLLALNATIEAARAGEAGRGFSVVASEVKSLAEQTARATEDIGAQIDEIQASTTQTVEAIREIFGRMSEVDHHATAIASAVQEQGAATGEISTSIAGAAGAAQAVAGAMTRLDGGVAETNRAAEGMLEITRGVTAQTARLRATVDHFLAEVAAA